MNRDSHPTDTVFARLDRNDVLIQHGSVLKQAASSLSLLTDQQKG